MGLSVDIAFPAPRYLFVHLSVARVGSSQLLLWYLICLPEDTFFAIVHGKSVEFSAAPPILIVSASLSASLPQRESKPAALDKCQVTVSCVSLMFSYQIHAAEYAASHFCTVNMRRRDSLHPVHAGIPVWIGWIRYLSFIYYGFGMLLHIEYHGRTIYSCVDPNAAASGAMSVQVRS